MNEVNTLTKAPVWRGLLCNTSFLWGLFLTTLVSTICFSYLSNKWGITLIDSISSPNEARTTVAGFSEEQRLTHAWVTSTLDVLYPFAYALLFAGIALRSFPNAGRLLIIPILLCIPVDLAEGIIQVLALTNTADFLDLKAVITPLKFGLFLFGLAVVVAAGVRWLFLRTRA